MRNLIIGFILGVAVTMAALLALALLFTGRALMLSASAPTSATLADPVVISIEAANPHDEPVVLDNLDFPNEFFEDFEVVALRPSPTADSPIGGLGTQTWYLELSVPPHQTRIVELEVVAKRAGNYVAEFQVCNSYEDCSWMVVPIEFAE